LDERCNFDPGQFHGKEVAGRGAAVNVADIEPYETRRRERSLDWSDTNSERHAAYGMSPCVALRAKLGGPM
jgi:hypothetical protein